jgi:hypothetical protein
MDLKARLQSPVSWLVLVCLAALIVLVQAAVMLSNAGLHADATATLTPSDADLWIRAVSAFALALTGTAVLVSARVGSRHPALATISTFLFSLGLSQLAYDVYWWWAAGSYADMANKQIPRSMWRSLPIIGSGLLVSAVFGFTTIYLLAQRNADYPRSRTQWVAPT